MGLQNEFNPLSGQFNLVNDGQILSFKPVVANEAALPPSGNNENDARIVADTGHLYVWNGSAWIDQGDIIDLTSSGIINDSSIPGATVNDALNYIQGFGSPIGIRYIDISTGDNVLGDGSFNRPYKTLQRAVTDFGSNDNCTFYIYPGDYNEDLTPINLPENTTLFGFGGNITTIEAPINLISNGLSQTIIFIQNVSLPGGMTIDLTLSMFGIISLFGGAFNINRLDDTFSLTTIQGGSSGTYRGKITFNGGAVVNTPITIEAGSNIDMLNMNFIEKVILKGDSVLKTVNCTQLFPFPIVEGIIESGNTPTWKTDAISDLGYTGDVNKVYLDTSSTTQNLSTVTGDTVTDALETLDSNKEDNSNKSLATDLGGGAASDILYPSQKAVKTYVDANLGGGNLLSDVIRLQLNQMLIAFRMSIQNSLTIQQMVDSFVDEYEDESAIDVGNCINQYYDTNLDAYDTQSPSGSTIFLLHGNSFNGDTNIIDEKGHTVIVSGTPVITTGTSKFGGSSINFPFPFGYLQVNDIADMRLGTGDWTIDTWCWLEPGQGTAAFRPFFLIGGDSSSYDIGVVRSGGASNYDLVVGGNLLSAPIVTGYSLPQGTWFHLALTRFGDTIEVYIDGVSKGTTSCTGADFTNGLLYVGGNATGGGGDQYYGKMDEFRILKGGAVWTSGFTPEVSEYTGNESLGIVQDITLISLSQTADAVPDEARIILFTEEIDAITENTDIKAYVSRDNGSTFTQITLIDEGYYTTNSKILSGTIVFPSGTPSGTSMVYKIETHNTKHMRFHGTSMLWK